MSASNGDSLPLGWAITRLSDVADINPRGPDHLPNDDDLVSFVPMAAVEAMSGRLNSDILREWKTVKKGFTRFKEGDVLIAKITPCMENGKVALARNLHAGLGAGSTEFHVLRPTRVAESKFLMYYALQEQFRKDARAKMTGTAGQLRVPASFLEERVLELPPVPEQRRIVGAIESYLTKLDAAVAALERVRANLKRYRASVLKAAVEGRLVPTEADLARKEGRDFEPASMLLERILAERRRRWEESELARLKAAGKPPKDDHWKSKYKEPVAPDTSTLPQLPDGWCWTTVDQLAWSASYGSSARCAYDGRGEPVLRIPNVQNESISLDDLKFSVHPLGIVGGDALAPGDFLVIRTNGSRDLIARAAVVDRPFAPTHYFASYLIRLRLVLESPTWYWVLAVWHTREMRRRLEAEAATSAGQYNIRLSSLTRRAVPLPPLREQARINDALESASSAVDAAANTTGASMIRSNRLRQSILKWAFEGKLVDQDPNDESASVLLERIRAERAAMPSRKSRKTSNHQTEAAK